MREDKAQFQRRVPEHGAHTLAMMQPIHPATWKLTSEPSPRYISSQYSRVPNLSTLLLIPRCPGPLASDAGLSAICSDRRDAGRSTQGRRTRERLENAAMSVAMELDDILKPAAGAGPSRASPAEMTAHFINILGPLHASPDVFLSSQGP